MAQATTIATTRATNQTTKQQQSIHWTTDQMSDQ